jgi:hypothetical protein
MSERIFEWLDNVRAMPQMFLNHSPTNFCTRNMGWGTSCGFVDAIRMRYPNPEAAWNRFWELLDISCDANALGVRER